CFFFQAEDGIRDFHVTGVQTCALPILWHPTIALALQTKTICHANGNTHSVLKGVADAELPLVPPRTEVEVLVVNGALYLHRTGTARHPCGDARDVPRALVLDVSHGRHPRLQRLPQAQP